MQNPNALAGAHAPTVGHPSGLAFNPSSVLLFFLGWVKNREYSELKILPSNKIVFEIPSRVKSLGIFFHPKYD